MHTWQFWMVVVFDVTLLIMRDADLYDDIAIYVKRHTGGLGLLVMRVGELLVGPDMASVSDGTRRSAQQRSPTEKQRAEVKRELTENCIVSELLASMVLFVMVLTLSPYVALLAGILFAAPPEMRAVAINVLWWLGVLLWFFQAVFLFCS